MELRARKAALANAEPLERGHELPAASSTAAPGGAASPRASRTQRCTTTTVRWRAPAQRVWERRSAKSPPGFATPR